MYFSVDRIIEKHAVLMGEDGKPLEVLLSMLPPAVKEGTMVRYDNGEFVIDEQKTKERRERVANALEQLLKSKEE